MFAGARTCNNDPDSHPSKWLQSTEDNEIVAAWELTVATVAGIVTVRDQPKLYVISISLPLLDSFPQNGRSNAFHRAWSTVQHISFRSQQRVFQERRLNVISGLLHDVSDLVFSLNLVFCGYKG